MIEILAYSVLISLSVTTGQLVVMKNNWDGKYNNKYSHITGSYCFLCISFWAGLLVTTGSTFLMKISLFEYALLIFSVPAIVNFLLKDFLNPK